MSVHCIYHIYVYSLCALYQNLKLIEHPRGRACNFKLTGQGCVVVGKMRRILRHHLFIVFNLDY